MLTRRQFGALAVAGLAVGRHAAAAERYEPTLNDDGLYTQPWFLQTFLDMREDLAEVTARGKRFAVIWELRGCPYCKTTHLVNFAEPRIHEYVRGHFDILQLNMSGARAVTDFDGEVIEERALARKHRVIYSPTIQFFPENVDEVGGASGKRTEVFRMSGYLKPPHFLTMFEYVAEKAYETVPFRAYLKDKKDRIL